VGPYVLLNVALVGFFGFAAVYHLVIWWYSRRESVLLVFAAHTALCSIFSALIVVLVTARTPPEAQTALELRTAVAVLVQMTSMWIASLVSGVRARWFVAPVTILLATVAVVSLAGVPLTGTVTGVEQIATRWGESVSLLHRESPSPWLRPVYVLVWSCNLFGLYCAVPLWRRDRAGAILLGTAMATCLYAAFWAFPIDTTGTRRLYMGAVPYVGWVLLIALQITREFRLAEEARRRLEIQLAQSQKLEAVGQLAGGVAHDFNNLLTVINGYVDVLLSITDDNRLRQPLEQIDRAGKRAAALTRQLLAFGRHTVVDVKELDLNHVVWHAEQMLRRVIGEDIELTVRGASDLARIKADPSQLERVLVNLVINARDAMPRGGALAIETWNVDADADYRVAHPQASAGRYAVLAVRDTGCGMSPDVMAHLFEPFYTTKPAGEGTGLGLAVVDGVVKQMGGHIEVDSEPNRGTTFRIFFPALDQHEAAVSERDQNSVAMRGTETVLLVEDEDGVREVARIALERYGYTVLAAANVPDALRLARGQSQRVDLLLTDVVMPGVSGPEMVEALSSDHPELKVLFMSGYAGDEALRRGVAAGQANLLDKPFTLAALARKVRDVLDAPSQRTQRT
jgi:signal transduction histidine kinase/ActR/RegA family two-component response regulator